MLLDGEALVAVGGEDALLELVDMTLLLATARWPATREGLSEYYPPRAKGLSKLMIRLIKDMM